MKEKFYALLIEMIREHPRTFELFAFILILSLVQVCIEFTGLASPTSNAIVLFGGGFLVLAILVGAMNDSGMF